MDKIAVFTAFHSKIDGCKGGMVARLSQYLDSDIIQNVILENFRAEIIDKNLPLEGGAEIHIDSLIKSLSQI